MSPIAEVVLDPGFQALLNAHQQEYVDSEAYSTWMPPDGEYIALVKKADYGPKGEEAAADGIPWARLTGEIIEKESELHGKTFMIGYYSAKAWGIMKAAANVLTDENVEKDVNKAVKVIVGSVGLLLQVRVDTVFNKARQRKFKNCSILRVIQCSTSVPENTQPGPVSVAG